MPLLQIPCMLVEVEADVFESLPIIKHHYFKFSHGWQGKEMSGLPLPPPGMYYFQNCVFHPALADELDQYQGSQFNDCDMP